MQKIGFQSRAAKIKIKKLQNQINEIEIARIPLKISQNS